MDEIQLLATTPTSGARIRFRAIDEFTRPIRRAALELQCFGFTAMAPGHPWGVRL